MGCIHADGGSPNYECSRCSNEQERAWRLSLVANTLVGVRAGYGETVQLSTVLKVTPTQIVVGWGAGGGELRFRRESGSEVGRIRGRASWGVSARTLVEPTPTMLKQIEVAGRRRYVLGEIEAIKWSELDIDDLERVLDLLATIERK